MKKGNFRMLLRNLIKQAETKQYDIPIVSSTFVCEHPPRQRDYYSDTTYKCWECKEIVVAN